MASCRFAFLSALLCAKVAAKSEHDGGERQSRITIHAHRVATRLHDAPAAKQRVNAAKIVATNGQTNKRPDLSANNSNTQFCIALKLLYRGIFAGLAERRIRSNWRMLEL